VCRRRGKPPRRHRQRWQLRRRRKRRRLRRRLDPSGLCLTRTDAARPLLLLTGSCSGALLIDCRRAADNLFKPPRLPTLKVGSWRRLPAAGSQSCPNVHPRAHGAPLRLTAAVGGFQRLYIGPPAAQVRLKHLLVPLLPYPPLPLVPAGTRRTQVRALYGRLVGRKRLRLRAVSKRGGGRCGRGSHVSGTPSQGSPSGGWLRKKDRAIHDRIFMYYSLPRYETQR